MKTSRSHLRRCPRLRTSAARGEWAEAAFLAKALGLGFAAFRPFCDHHRFDFLVISPHHKVSRVQVKSTWAQHPRGAYVFNAAANRRLYRSSEVDFLVGYVVPEDAWYIIPVRKLTHGTPAVFPQNLNSRGKFEPYREAWHLLQ